jgi:hypothetical protein
MNQSGPRPAIAKARCIEARGWKRVLWVLLIQLVRLAD